MGFISALLGSIVAIVPLAGVLILLPHVGRIKSQTAKHWIHRAMIVITYGAGTLLATTEVGSLWQSFVNYASGLVPGLSGSAEHALITIISFVLIIGLIGSFLFAPEAAVVTAAAFIPAVLLLTTGGFVHNFWIVTSAPAAHAAAQFGAWMGG